MLLLLLPPPHLLLLLLLLPPTLLQLPRHLLLLLLPLPLQLVHPHPLLVAHGPHAVCTPKHQHMPFLPWVAALPLTMESSGRTSRTYTTHATAYIRGGAPTLDPSFCCHRVGSHVVGAWACAHFEPSSSPAFVPWTMPNWPGWRCSQNLRNSKQQQQQRKFPVVVGVFYRNNNTSLDDN